MDIKIKILSHSFFLFLKIGTNLKVYFVLDL